MRIRIDPEFRTLISPLAAKERKLLEESIAEFGIIEPLIVWQETGILLDGHNRHEIAERERARVMIAGKVREILGAMESGEEQLYLHGCEMPAVLAVKREGEETLYVHLHAARWEHLLRAHDMRLENISRAMAREVSFRRFMKLMQPVMDGTDLTVLEALETMAARMEGEA